MQDLSAFFEPLHFIDSLDGVTYHPLQWGSKIMNTFSGEFDMDEADIILVGCGEWRGEDSTLPYINSADAIRKQLYQMYHWHEGIKIADAGNIRQGASLNDTRAALLIVLHEIEEAGKIAIVLGGSHDLTLQQYDVFKKREQMVVATVADMYIDLDETEETNHTSFLMDMLTNTPNFISHYSHIAFQSYYTQPRMLETLDKLRFDFFRLGKVTENIEEMEPVLRSSNMFSFDMSAVKFSDSPANVKGSPNGLTGPEACSLTRYAGSATNLSSFGIYGYKYTDDVHDMTAKLISQMLWYFVDGLLARKNEAKLTDINEFTVFNIAFTENDTVFLKSKRTNRWWMKLPDNTYIPCSYNDFIMASNNEMPERWLREQERLV